jgi:hypothetical protein
MAKIAEFRFFKKFFPFAVCHNILLVDLKFAAYNQGKKWIILKMAD